MSGNTLSGQTLSYDQMLNSAAVTYWINRPQYGPRCGTVYGYWDHRSRAQQNKPCAECKRARAMVVAIQRHRDRLAA